MPTGLVEPPTEDCLVLEWDTCKMAMAEARAICEDDPDQNEDDAFSEVLGDQYYWELAWEDLVDNLTGIMQGINPDGLWTVVGQDMGWRQLNGSKDFEAWVGKVLLESVLPNCDCSFRVYLIVDLIAINCAHHDSPVWAEWYYIRKRKE